MKTLGNILWFVFGGLILSALWGIVGIICCCTIIAIPVGIQCFKFASFIFVYILALRQRCGFF